LAKVRIADRRCTRTTVWIYLTRHPSW